MAIEAGQVVATSASPPSNQRPIWGRVLVALAPDVRVVWADGREWNLTVVALTDDMGIDVILDAAAADVTAFLGKVVQVGVFDANGNTLASPAFIGTVMSVFQRQIPIGGSTTSALIRTPTGTWIEQPLSLLRVISNR